MLAGCGVSGKVCSGSLDPNGHSAGNCSRCCCGCCCCCCRVAAASDTFSCSSVVTIVDVVVALPQQASPGLALSAFERVVVAPPVPPSGVGL
eukprot:765665-Prorocentrum_minimum.AAC.1